MKTENLEALLIDRALGELPPATTELLDEYLMRNPAVSKEAEEFTHTLGIAEKVLRIPATKTLRAFPREALEREQRVLKWRRNAYLVLKLAACLALGFFIGSFGKAPTNTGAITKVESQSHTTSVNSIAVGKSLEPVAGLWSVARLKTLAKAQKPVTGSDRYQFSWESTGGFQKAEGKL